MVLAEGLPDLGVARTLWGRKLLRDDKRQEAEVAYATSDPP
jgi:hypothetical protein